MRAMITEGQARYWGVFFIGLSCYFVSALSVVTAADLGDRQVLVAMEGDPPRDKALRRAMLFLKEQQGENGAYGEVYPVASTGLGIMAHLACGITPTDTTYGPGLQQALRYQLRSQGDDGYFGASDNSRMYGHGITTLMLAEVLGMCGDEELDDQVRSALVRAVAVTIAAAEVEKDGQNRGGWRYTPKDRSSDLSLSGWQLMSLHATAQVGILVPEAVIYEAVGFAKRVTSPDGRVGYEKTGQDHVALRGAALVSFVIGGDRDAPEIARIADRIVSTPIAWQGPYLFYRSYYEAVGLSRAAPAVWDVYAGTLESVLIDHQAEDGSWPPPPGDNEAAYGAVYRTAMACLALAVNKHLLPAYQR